MHTKKHKKKYTFLHLNRVRIFTEFEHAQLKYVQMLTNPMSFSVAGILCCTPQNLRNEKINSFANFFFVHPAIAPSLKISVFPSLKNFQILGRSSGYREAFSFNLAKQRNFRFKPNLLKKYGEPVSFKKARYLAFFEYGLTLFEWRDVGLRLTRRGTFLSFEDWYGWQSLVSAKYAKVAGSFIIFPYWVNTVVLSWTWLFWLSYQELTLFITSPARLFGNSKEQRISLQGFNYALSNGANLGAISCEASSAILNFYLFMLLFLYMLDTRQTSFIKLLDALNESSTPASANSTWATNPVLVPKPLKIGSGLTFAFFSKSWSNLFNYISEKIKRFTLLNLPLTSTSFYRSPLIQSRLYLDISDSLAKFEVREFLIKWNVPVVLSGNLVNVRRYYADFFMFNNLFRPKFLSFCLIWQAFSHVLTLTGIRIYTAALSELVFFCIKQTFSFLFSFFSKKRVFFSKYFIENLLSQTFYFKIRVLRLFLSIFLNFCIVGISTGFRRLFLFIWLGFVVFFCYLVKNFLVWGILLGIIWFTYLLFYKFLRIENTNFFSIFGNEFLFSGKALTRLVYYMNVVFTSFFDFLWVLIAVRALSRSVLACMQPYCQKIWWHLTFLINFWLSKIFFGLFKKHYSSSYCFSVKVSALICWQIFNILRINIRLADCWYVCALISVRELMWLLLGFVQIFWAQLAWWRHSAQNVEQWRQNFSVNKILFATGAIQRGPVLNSKLMYMNIFEYLAIFLSRRRFLFQNKKLASKFTENFILYFSFLSNSKVNLLCLNWFANMRLFKLRRSETRVLAHISTQRSWKLARLLMFITVWVCAGGLKFLGFLIYWLLRLVVFFLLLIQFSIVSLFLYFLVLNISFFLLLYLVVKLFLLIVIFSNFRS